jgi:hypothetical protein
VLTASELQQMTGRAGRRGRDRVGFIVAAPGQHQDPHKLAALLHSPPDPLESQFRATYTTLLNLLDAYGTFSQVRDIAERSFSQREAGERLTRLERERAETEGRMRERLGEAGCHLPPDAARGLERLASARTRLLEGAPHTRFEATLRWLDKEVVPGRVVGVGRSGRRLVFVTERRADGLVGYREDGRRASVPLERIGRVYATVFARDEPAREEADRARLPAAAVDGDEGPAALEGPEPLVGAALPRDLRVGGGGEGEERREGKSLEHWWVGWIHRARERGSEGTREETPRTQTSLFP